MEELEEVEKNMQQTINISPYLYEDADWQKAKILLKNKRKKRAFFWPFITTMLSAFIFVIIADTTFISSKTNNNKDIETTSMLSIKNQTTNATADNNQDELITNKNNIQSILNKQESSKSIHVNNEKHTLGVVKKSGKNYKILIPKNTSNKKTSKEYTEPTNNIVTSFSKNEIENSRVKTEIKNTNQSTKFDLVANNYNMEKSSENRVISIAEIERFDAKKLDINKIVQTELQPTLTEIKKDSTKKKNWKVKVLFNLNPGTTIYSHFNNNKPYAQFGYQVFTTIDVNLKKNFSLRTGLQIIHAFDAGNKSNTESIKSDNFTSSDVTFLSIPILLNSDVSNVKSLQKIRIINKIQLAIPVAVQYTFLQKNVVGAGLQTNILVGGKTNVTEKISGTINNPAILTSINPSGSGTIPITDIRFRTLYVTENYFETNEYNHKISNKSIFPLFQLGCIFYYDRIIKDKFYVGFNTYFGATKALKSNDYIESGNVHEYFIGLNFKYKIR